MPKLLKFAASYYAKRVTEAECNNALRLTQTVWEAGHAVDVIEAVNKDHAVGIGYRVVHKLFPESDGWEAHDVRVRQV